MCFLFVYLETNLKPLAMKSIKQSVLWGIYIGVLALIIALYYIY